jgi:hypothetical protein
MKRAGSIFLGAVISLSCLNTSSWASAQQPVSQDSNVTLYSVIKHPGERRKSCINFKVGLLRTDCDLSYGLMYAGDELDWFQSSTAQGNRSVIKDLGKYDWSTWFEVPVVEPLAKLKPGEQRHVTIDVSEADGANGAPGRNGTSGLSNVRTERDTPSLTTINNERPERNISPTVSAIDFPPIPPSSKRERKPKIDPLFVKAIAGHMYVIHVVDDSRDFYALFRVEALQKGDNCTVNWKLIPEPINQSGKSALR